MKNFARFGSLAAALAVAGVSYGQTAQSPAPAATTPGASSSMSVEFGSVDENKDGRLSSAEVQSHSELRANFQTLDADRDNYLTQSEFSKWSKAGKAPDGASGSPGNTGSSTTPNQPRSTDDAIGAPESATEAKNAEADGAQPAGRLAGGSRRPT